MDVFHYDERIATMTKPFCDEDAHPHENLAEEGDDYQVVGKLTWLVPPEQAQACIRAVGTQERERSG